MRLYHTAYRQKNPTRKAGLRGSKKKLHADIMRILNPSRRKNPDSAPKKKAPKAEEPHKPVSFREAEAKDLFKKRGLTRAVKAYNLLGRIDVEIKEYAIKAGDRKATSAERKNARRHITHLMGLRDTIQARISGNIDDENLEYALAEAIKDLTAAEVRAIQKMLTKRAGIYTGAGGSRFIGPEEGAMIRERAKMDPVVQKIQARVSRLTNLSEESKKRFEAAIQRNQLSVTEWARGTGRHGEIMEAEAAEAEEMGDVIFDAADEALWARVVAALKKKYPSKYIPPRDKRQKEKELKLLIEMSHADTTAKRKKTIRKGLNTILNTRLRNKAIVLYEKAGGRPKTRLEVQIEKQIKDKETSRVKRQKALGVGFTVGQDRHGVIDKSGKGFKWALFDSKGNIYLWGTSATNNAASKSIGIAYRIDESLSRKGKGWDDLPVNDRRWIENNRPTLSKIVARKMLKNINKRVKVDRSTALWIAKAADLGTKEVSSVEMIKTCKGMTIGEEREFRGKQGAYMIHVRRGTGTKYAMKVVMKDGRESTRRNVDGCSKVLKRAHALAGAMTGAAKVAKAAKNPTKIRRLNSDARRYFAKQNPKMPRQTAESADIKELAGMFKIPDDNEAAFKYGLYFGIVRGIDTCGVQNYFKRKRIRKTYQERLIEGLMSETARAGGISVPKQPEKHKKSASESRDESRDQISAADQEAVDELLEEMAARLGES